MCVMYIYFQFVLMLDRAVGFVETCIYIYTRQMQIVLEIFCVNNHSVHLFNLVLFIGLANINYYLLSSYLGSFNPVNLGWR